MMLKIWEWFKKKREGYICAYCNKRITDVAADMVIYKGKAHHYYCFRQAERKK